MVQFSPVDPLKAKTTAETEVAVNALKKEIENILSSYVGWYDPFGELIQNALDSIEERQRLEGPSYVPRIGICVDIQANTLTVFDNGIGLDEQKFKQFLAPSLSFKSGKNQRGHKGVGATYLAYGFNFIRISTKADDFETVGRMRGARDWLSDESPPGNPQLTFDDESTDHEIFDDFDKGVSITVKFDAATHPKQLSWLGAATVGQWRKILHTKTGLGAFQKNEHVEVYLEVTDQNGAVTVQEVQGIEYFWPHQIVTRSIQFSELGRRVSALFEKHGPSYRLPNSLKNIECIYDTLDFESLLEMLEFSEAEMEVLNRFCPTVYFAYMYSTKVWSKFNEELEIRKGVSILQPGLQLCANMMPQGEMIQIPLRRNVGRQNQIMVLLHFDNCVPDLGRKGFQSEITEIAKVIGRKVIEDLVNRYRKNLRVTTGVRPDLKREGEVSDWKKEMETHEQERPMLLTNENFFKPVNEISITSEPTREQDVIALFSQLLAGGVIRGIRLMSTNERFTYDGMYRVHFREPDENHIYDATTNPLGVDADYAEEHRNFTSEAKILEYKYSLDGLIEDIGNGTKNSNDISLVVVWETGEDYIGQFEIMSLLVPENLSDRQYHGVTHTMTNLSSGQREMDLIVLKELVQFLNDPEGETKRQIEKYAEV